MEPLHPILPLQDAFKTLLIKLNGPRYIKKRPVRLNTMQSRLLVRPWILAGLLPSEPIVALYRRGPFSLRRSQ